MTAAAGQGQSNAKRRVALTAFALLGLAAAAAAIIGTHGRTWGKVRRCVVRPWLVEKLSVYA